MDRNASIDNNSRAVVGIGAQQAFFKMKKSSFYSFAGLMFSRKP